MNEADLTLSLNSNKIRVYSLSCIMQFIYFISPLSDSYLNTALLVVWEQIAKADETSIQVRANQSPSVHLSIVTHCIQNDEK